MLWCDSRLHTSQWIEHRTLKPGFESYYLMSNIGRHVSSHLSCWTSLRCYEWLPASKHNVTSGSVQL